MNRVKYTIMHSMDEIVTPCQSDGKCPVILIDCDAQSACYEYAQRLQDRIMYWMISWRWIQVFVFTITSFKVMNRIANVIKIICQFFISSSFSRLFSPDSLFFDKVFWSVVTVNEKTTNFFTSALCDAGVAVTLTCVTMPRGVLGSDERINRKELFC